MGALNGMKSTQTFVRYVDRTELGSLAVTLSFSGPQWGTSSVLLETDVQLICYEKLNARVPDSPWIEIWQRAMGNLSMPPAPWNGFKLTALVGERIFIGGGSHLFEVEAASGQTKWVIETGNTPVRYLLVSPDHSLLIVMNEFSSFRDPQSRSNLAAISLDGRELWRAEPPSPSDLYANAPVYKNGQLMATTMDCVHCTIDHQTGKILSRKFTK
jgi:outer membrane protein assembly factor BamB